MSAVVSLNHGDKAVVNGQRVIVGSVRGYAMQYKEDPEAAIARERERHHDLYWLGLTGSMICADKGYYERDRAEWVNATALTIGDSITIDDSPVLVIGPAPNHNFSLKAKA